MKPALLGILFVLASACGVAADTRWKYFTLTVVTDAKGIHAYGDDGQRIGAGQPVGSPSVTGFPTGEESPSTLTRYLNRLGDSGWELTAVVAINTMTTQYIFKQAKNAAPPAPPPSAPPAEKKS